MSQKVYRGTVAELLAMGLSINGVKMDQTGLSVLTRLGLANAVGKQEKKSRGQSATIWEIPHTIDTKLTAIASEATAEA